MNDIPIRSSLIFYGLPAVALAALTLPLYVVIPTFYAESLKIPVETIGLILLFIRLFDAVNDPLFGYLSDRWRPSWGRRRTWFLAFVPVAIIASWNLFWPPVDAGVLHLAVWSVILSIGYTGTILPYTAWGAELDTTYAGRSRVTATREGFILSGTLLAIALPFSIGWADPASFHGLALLAVAIAIYLPVTALLAVWRVPEPFEASTNKISIRDGLKIMAKNRPFIRLVVSFLFNGLGNAIAASLFLFYVSHRLGLEEMRGPFLLLYFFCGIVGIPLWIWVSKSVSKHRIWCIAMIFAICVFAPAPLLPQGSVVGFSLICVLSGLALGADLILPPSIQADVIDVDTARSGEQRTGTYFAVWSLITKLSLALSVGIAFPVLGWFGFQAAQGAESTSTGILALGYLYGWGPILFKLPAVYLMWNFPLTSTEVENNRKLIDAQLEETRNRFSIQS